MTPARKSSSAFASQCHQLPLSRTMILPLRPLMQRKRVAGDSSQRLPVEEDAAGEEEDVGEVQVQGVG